MYALTIGDMKYSNMWINAGYSVKYYMIFKYSKQR